MRLVNYFSLIFGYQIPDDEIPSLFLKLVLNPLAELFLFCRHLCKKKSNYYFHTRIIIRLGISEKIENFTYNKMTKIYTYTDGHWNKPFHTNG